MTSTFVDHLDGFNGVDLAGGSNTNFASIGKNNTSIKYDTSQFAAGTACAKIVQTLQFGSGSMVTPTFTATATQKLRFCFEIDALPTGGNVHFAEAITGATVSARLNINSSGKIALQNGTTVVATGTVNVPINQQNRLEWDLVGTTHTVRLYGSPTSTTVLDTITYSVMTGTTFTALAFGVVASSNTDLATMRFDEFSIDSSTQPGPLPAAITVSSVGTTVATGSSAATVNASSVGTTVATGASSAGTNGGKISGLVGTFPGSSLDTTKWTSAHGAGVFNAAVLPVASPAATLTSTKSWDLTASNCYVTIQPPASGRGDLAISLVSNADATKYVQVLVSGGQISAAYLNGVADPAGVTRAVTEADRAVRFTESAGSLLIEVRGHAGVWATLRTITSPAWFTDVRVVLSGYSASAGASAVFSNFSSPGLATTGHALSSTLSDDFTGSSLDATKWAVTGTGTVAVAGEVDISALSTVTQVASVASYQLDSASLQMKGAVGQAHDATVFKLLGPVPGTEARFTLLAGQLIAELCVGGIPDAYTTSVAWPAGTPVFCEFTGYPAGSSLTWSYSADGTTFAALRSSELPIWTTSVQPAWSVLAAA